MTGETTTGPLILGRWQQPAALILAGRVTPDPYPLEQILYCATCHQQFFGTHLPANVVLLGAAYQAGALPLPLDALHEAIGEGRGSAMNLAADGGVRRSLSPVAIRAGMLTAASDSERSKSTRLGKTLAQTSTSVPASVLSTKATWLGEGFEPNPNRRVPR